MRRILLAALILVIAGVSTLGVRSWFERQARRRREAAYNSILQSYTRALKPGMTRKEVEDYLDARGVHFQQMCCFEGQSWGDLIRIGAEDHPWFCSEHNVYVAFQYTNSEQ